MAKKYINPIKENLYKQYGHKFSDREQFNKFWSQTMRDIVGKFGFGRTKEKLSQQTAFILREDLLKEKFKEKSLFFKITDLKSSKATDILKIEKEIYIERTEDFRQKYGTEIFEIRKDENGNEIKITLEDKFKEFENGDINQDQMNDVIEDIKKSSKEYNAQEKYTSVKNYTS